MNPAAAHVIPFASWIALMLLLEKTGMAPAWAYAVRTGVCLAVLFWCRPWRWYEKPKLQNLPPALFLGLVVFVAWVYFESRWCPLALSNGYEKWGVLPFGKMRDPMILAHFHPNVCGWSLTLARLAGSALVISVIEEFFWRGFLYRWMFGGDFLKTDPARFEWPKFLLVAAAFGFEHSEWLAGIAAGLAYGLLYVKTRDIWACCAAHAATNFMLGIYVLKQGAWQFW